MKKQYDIKVTGYEAVYAESEEEALEIFEKYQRVGYTISNLRWKSITVERVEDD